MDVNGAAQLAGAKEVAVTGRMARMAIRSTGEEGDVRVLASGKELKSGELRLKANHKTMNAKSSVEK